MAHRLFSVEVRNNWGLKLGVNVCSVTDNLTAAILSRCFSLVKDFLEFTSQKSIMPLMFDSKIDLLNQ